MVSSTKLSARRVVVSQNSNCSCNKMIMTCGQLMFISLCQEEVKSLTTVNGTGHYFNRSAAMGWVFGTYSFVSFLLRGSTTSL